jgi:hypothetical protein
MKILVLIGGRFNSIDENWWINLSDETGLEFDFALSKWSNCELQLGELIKSRIVWLDEEDPDEVGSIYKNLGLNEIRNQDYAKPFNTLMMWHKWSRFIFFKNFDSYDCIIKTRADIEVDSQYFSNFAKAISDAAGCSKFIAIPSGGDHTRPDLGSPKGINDVLAIGSPKLMRIYLSIINNCEQYLNEIGVFHPETFLRFHLVNKNRLCLMRFPALITLRGSAYNHLIPNWYIDCLKIYPNFLARKLDRYRRKKSFF